MSVRRLAVILGIMVFAEWFFGLSGAICVALFASGWVFGEAMRDEVSSKSE